MYLPSNVDLEIFPDNTRTNYISNLPQALDLNEYWQVALQALNFDFKLPQIPPDTLTNVFQLYNVLPIGSTDETKFIHRCNISLTDKFYTITTLMKAIKDTIPEDFKSGIKIKENSSVFNLTIKPGILLFIKKNFLKWCYSKSEVDISFIKRQMFVMNKYLRGDDFMLHAFFKNF